MIADELGRLSSKLGMLHSAKGTNTVRVVFIVDPKGVLRLMLFYPQEAPLICDTLTVHTSHKAPVYGRFFSRLI